MRIVRLDLLAFGPFTNQSLDFDHSGEGLQLIYGPNEAGKSSCLRALRQWLYGIDHSSRDNFIHDHPKLRIGGAIENSLGEKLEFVRRKGTKRTIRAADSDAEIEQVQLSQFLGSVDQQTFVGRFAIDLLELVTGGQAIVKGGGELGEALFAAGSGLANVRAVQASIQDQLQELFKAGGTKPKINADLKRLIEAKEQIRSATLPSSQWSDVDNRLRDMQRQRDQLVDQHAQLGNRLRHRERIQKALPLLAERQRLIHELQPLADVPLLPQDFSARCGETTAHLNNSLDAQNRCRRDILQVEHTIERIQLPMTLLKQRVAIENLQANLATYRHTLQRQPDAIIQLQLANANAQRLWIEMERTGPLPSAESLQLGRSQRKRIQELAADHKSLLSQQTSARALVDKLKRDIDRMQTQSEGAIDPGNPEELKRAIRDIRSQGDVQQQVAGQREAVMLMQQQAQADLQRLPLFEGTLSELIECPVPLRETVDQYEKWLADDEAKTAALQKEIEKTNERLVQLDRTLNQLSLEHDVPTENELHQLRQQRDLGWQLIQRAWCPNAHASAPPDNGLLVEDSAKEGVEAGNSDALEVAMNDFVSRWAPHGELATAYANCVRAADLLADRLRWEAERVAEKASLTAERMTCVHRLHESQAQHQRLMEQCECRQQEWHQLWSAAGIRPRTPREMREWLSRYSSLLEAAQQISQGQQSLASLESKAASARQSLLERLRPLSPLSVDDVSLVELIEICESTVEASGELLRKRAQHHKELDQLREQLSQAELELQKADLHLQNWRSDWSSAVAAPAVVLLGMSNESSPSEVIAVMHSLDELLESLKQQSRSQQEIESMDRDVRLFEVEVRRVQLEVSPDAQLSQPALQVVEDLSSRLRSACEQQLKLQQLQEQLVLQKQNLSQADDDVRRYQKSLDDLCRQALCDQAELLPEIDRRSSERQRLEDRLADIQRQLESLATGQPVERLIEECYDCDADQIAADIERLTEQLKDLDSQKLLTSQSIGELRSELARMDGSAAAAQAQENAEQLLAAIREDSEHYVRLRLASAVLQRAIERFRHSSQGPVLERAGELFSELTLGSFSGLQADYTDDGHAILVGVRPGDQSNAQTNVPVEGMSAGTCDQLYLALRLALLESHLQDHQPMPFIVDDILIQFDDDRSLAALKVLNRLAQRTQVIFFTHHLRLVELARRHLKSPLPKIHTLQSGDNSGPEVSALAAESFSPLG